MRIKKGDKVIIVAGKDKGKTGSVEKALPKKQTVIVIGVNMRKKHLKPSRQNPQGGIKEYSAPIDISNIKFICPKCDKPTRISFEITKDSKERKCKRCKQLV